MSDTLNHPVKRYEDGCRCETCVEHHNARVRRNRAERLAEGRLSHGSRSAYDAGCRCDACRAKRSEIRKREYAQERAARRS